MRRMYASVLSCMLSCCTGMCCPMRHQSFADTQQETNGVSGAEYDLASRLLGRWIVGDAGGEAACDTKAPW